MEAIPEGVQTVANLVDQPAEVLWAGLKSTVRTPEQVAKFNAAVAAAVSQGKERGFSREELAQSAMSAAGDAILGTDRPMRPTSPADEILRMAGPFLRRVDRGRHT